MSENLENLFLIIRHLSNYDIPREFNDSINLATQRVQELTESVWSEHHGELLNYLDLLSQNTDHDIQQFWFECLRFPYDFPPKRKKDGLIVDDFGGLPSDFNKISFHDSVIKKIEERNNIYFEIDLITTWRDREHDWVQEGRRTKVSFENPALVRLKKWDSTLKSYCNSKYKLADIQEVVIITFYEVPITRYVFQKLELGGEYSEYVNRRLFILDDLIGSQITLVSNNWSLEEIGDGENKRIGYA